MKKLITAVIASLFSLCMFTIANAGEVYGTQTGGAIGVSMNKQGFGAYGKETNGTAVTEEYGAFGDTYASVFAEFSFGNGLSLGVEYTPGTISTPTNTNVQQNGSTGGVESAGGGVTTGGTAATNTVKAEFDNLYTLYVMAQSEMGVYARLGFSSVDINTQETLGTGGSYNNVNTDGGTVAFGYQKTNDGGIFVRAEVAGTVWDDVSASNTTDSTKIIKISDMMSGGASIKIGKIF